MSALPLMLLFLSAVALTFQSCKGKSKSNNLSAATDSLSDDALMDTVQRRTFLYFWEGAEPNSGLAPERYHVDGVYPENDANVVTSGGSGFGIMAILAGIERGYVTREEGLARMERIVSFLEKADRFHGAYPHWWYGDTGKVKPFGQKDNGGDLVETAFLIQGLLAVHQYYVNGNEKEKALAQRIDQIWRDVDWNWYRQGGQNVLYWHWSPTYGWEMNFPVHGYNECMIMYILAAASPTHGVPAAVYHDGWAQNGAIVSPHKVEGIELHLRYQGTEAGPLFWAQYSFLGLDPVGLKDEYCPSYFHEMRNLTLVNRAYCIRNPKHYKGFGPDCWGLTASYSVNGYAAHSPNEQEDKGVISPTAALSSIVYTPLYYAHKNTGRPLKDGKWFEKFRSNYLDVDNDPLYPFGYGLSYTTFSYSDIDLSHSSMDMNGSLTAAVEVTNTGTWPGSEVVQLYIRDVVGSSTRPVKELKGFQKIFLEPGEMKIVRFKIAPEMLRYYNYDLQLVAEPGDFEVMIGTNSRDVKTAKFTLN